MGNMKKWILILVTSLALAACSKDDTEGENEPIVNETTVFTSQLVTLFFPDTVLSEVEYQGTFNGQDIVLMRNDEHTLMFMVAASTPVGAHALNIPALNTTINYDVQATILNGTPDAVISPFFSGVNGVEQLLGESPRATSFQSAIDSFNEVYENSTPQQKQAFAIYYSANKELFDKILYPDFDNVSRTKGIDTETIKILAKHSYGVYLLAGGTIAAIFAPGPEKPLAILVAEAGAALTLHQFDQLMEKHPIKSNLNADGTVSIINRTFNGISLADDVTKIVTLATVDRKFAEADATSTNSDIISFFKDYNRYNYYVGKLNTGISWVNDNIPFCNFSLIELEQLSSGNELVNTAVTPETFNNITFSINHPNLTLVSAQFQGNGQLNLKVKITNPSITEPIESELNYTFNDGLSIFSGKFPIKVEETTNPLVGTWIMESFADGIPIGEYYNVTAAPVCPDLVYAQHTYNYWNITFNADNTFSQIAKMTFIDFGITSIDNVNCVPLNNGPDTSHSEEDGYGGPYTQEGNTVSVPASPGSSNQYVRTLTFINPNKIKLGTEVYNRQ